MDRTVLHCDANNFFASIESVDHPEYNDVPMAVCGSKEKRHGIILAKNERAKRCGVKTGEAIWQAKQKCSDLLLVEPHYSLYRQYSKEMSRIFASYTDLIEPFGLDESWLDVTASRGLFGDGEKIAERLRSEIKLKLGITVSVGVSFNKTFAKLCSDLKKPDATTVVLRENFKQRLFPLPAELLLFVGKSTSLSLRRVGLYTIGDVASANRDFLIRTLGKSGARLWEYANGLDDSPVAKEGYESPLKSLSNGMTFRRNLHGVDDVSFAVHYLSDEIAARLRSYGMRCGMVEISVRDTDMHTSTRSVQLECPTNLEKDIALCALKLICDNFDIGGEIYSLTVGVGKLNRGDDGQCCMFDGGFNRDKRYRLECAVDGIRRRFGSNSLIIGSAVGNTLCVGGEAGESLPSSSHRKFSDGLAIEA